MQVNFHVQCHALIRAAEKQLGQVETVPSAAGSTVISMLAGVAAEPLWI